MALVVMIMITALTLGFGLYQDLSIKKLEEELTQTQAQIASLKDKEGVVTVLGGRLAKIISLSKKESKSAKAFILISDLSEGKVKIQNFASDKDTKVRLSAEAPAVANLDEFFASLNDPKQNQGLISSVKLDSLGKAKGNLTFDLVLTLTGGSKQ